MIRSGEDAPIDTYDQKCSSLRLLSISDTNDKNCPKEDTIEKENQLPFSSEGPQFDVVPASSEDTTFDEHTPQCSEISNQAEDVNVENSTKDKESAPSKSIGCKGNNSSNLKIIVTKLDSTITSKDIKAYFEQFGTVIDIKTLTPIHNCAFVTFSKFHSLGSLFSENHIINGNTIKIHPNLQLRDKVRAFLRKHDSPWKC